MNPLPITPPATSHPRHHHQGPLDKTWRSLHRHRRRRPPSLSSSATAAIVAITGLVVAWCRLPPPSSSPSLSTTDATPPTTASPPLRLVLLPPCDPPPPVAVAPSPPSRSPMAPSWTGMRRRHPPSWSDAASAAPARAPLVGIRAHCASAAVTTAAMPRFPLWRPAGDPPLLLGPPPPVGRRRRQHIDADTHPWQPGATTIKP